MRMILGSPHVGSGIVRGPRAVIHPGESPHMLHRKPLFVALSSLLLTVPFAADARPATAAAEIVETGNATPDRIA
ncbi:MAG TPA: hypothetical protein VFL14_05945, partial [Xanthomonadales bacterium]|nr:hypothetical protein [Xanthomonadales bacterium]